MSRPSMFVAEYDLPADYRRKRFYRAVKRYLKKNSIERVGWSTGSVVFSHNEDFVWFVYREARKVGGVAHVYRAERLDGEGT